MTTQIWQHAQSGDQFAVALDSYNQIVGAAGPLHHSEISAALRNDWDSDPDVTAEIKSNPDQYYTVA